MSLSHFIGHAKAGLLVRAQEDEVEGEETDDGAVEDEEGGSEVENEEQDEDASEEESEGDSKKNACETLRQESVAGADLVRRALNCCPKMRKNRRIGAQTVSVSTDETGGR